MRLDTCILPIPQKLVFCVLDSSFESSLFYLLLLTKDKAQHAKDATSNKVYKAKGFNEYKVKEAHKSP